ncbi:GntR family transcriptional regulator [Ectobacillus panaciterrae]|uniref:GntR family transcriptional regulator n=1 Tax=Ectobacillus panaciterrae TaxID=363872 RepID=UPI000410B71A|nr:GntR family transcriptional regulator [Ectobacillus panaciterrae]
MLIQLDPRSSTPIWEQIVNSIKELILKDILSPQDKLPSVRELASTLVVNPNTVSKAYQELERQGVIETLRGRGTFVAEMIIPRKDEQKMAALEQQLKQILMEATYLGVSKDTLVHWLNNYYNELGGDKDAEGGKRPEND